MIRFSADQPFDLRVSGLPFPEPVSDHERIANVLWLLQDNPKGRAPLPAPDGDAPRFAAVVPSPDEHATVEDVLARMAASDAQADAGQQSGEPSPQIGQSLLAQSSGGSSGKRRSTIANPMQDPKFNDFFNRHYEPVAKIGRQFGVDPSLILGLSAHESLWGTSRLATQLNNPFGQTPDGVNPTTFSSVDAAWEQWGKDHGLRVQDVGSDAEKFVDRLLIDNRNVYGPRLGGDRLGAYNSRRPPLGDPAWRGKVLEVINGVRLRLPLWQTANGMLPQREE